MLFQVLILELSPSGRTIEHFVFKKTRSNILRPHKMNNGIYQNK